MLKQTICLTGGRICRTVAAHFISGGPRRVPGGSGQRAPSFAWIRGTAQLNSPIEEGQKSTMRCHLGNIACRTNTVVRCDPKTGHLIDNPAGEKLSKREYRAGWEPKNGTRSADGK